MRLEDAIAFAAHAHAGQVDKAGESYILHCLRVMLGVDGQHIGIRRVAVLHDVAEDVRGAHLGPLYLSAKGMTCILTPFERASLAALTRERREPYEDYIARVARDDVAAEVKRADLRDNLGRIENLTEKDQDRLIPRYEKAIRMLDPRRPAPSTSKEGE